MIIRNQEKYLLERLRRKGIDNIQHIHPPQCGDFHVFYKGVDRRTGKKLFIKWDKNLSGSVKREGEILKLPMISVSSFFPNIIYEETDFTFPYIAVEYIEGVNLKEYLSAESGRKLLKSDSKKREMIDQLVKIAKILFQEKIVHRDIRPGNFLVKKKDGRFQQLILIDFAFSIRLNELPELKYLQGKKEMLKSLGTTRFKPESFTWDNIYSIERIIKMLDRKFSNNHSQLARELEVMKGKQIFTTGDL
ncbi:protein kinase domain-containing protein [Evansella tamaricis]|uniref:Protein kinase n=1 Tax=Evansella tamaricis TaxID=2069301 RepID=A0ABS6JLW0_9BACI|nr:AarF/UbiB family protein [Evansella tamaricis]MBU9713303.1 protein kinase [Evansella tamaricis]